MALFIAKPELRWINLDKDKQIVLQEHNGNLVPMEIKSRKSKSGMKKFSKENSTFTFKLESTKQCSACHSDHHERGDYCYDCMDKPNFTDLLNYNKVECAKCRQVKICPSSGICYKCEQARNIKTCKKCKCTTNIIMKKYCTECYRLYKSKK